MNGCECALTTPERVPVRWEARDDSFDTDGDAMVERLFDGGRWLDGAAYSPVWRCVLFSDIPNDRVLRWDEVTGAVSAFRDRAGFVNGRTLDRAGRVVTCEQGTRRVTRTEHDGTVTVVADRWQGERFNSPNDVVETADGSLWFTDPSYGIDSDYEGHRTEPELDGCHVYRRTPDGGVLAECDAGFFDGVRLDHRGRLWLAAHDGLHCVDPDDGQVLGKSLLPEVCSNLTFGGPRGNRLFGTATTSLSP